MNLKGNENNGIVCKDCFVYAGAEAKVVFAWGLTGVVAKFWVYIGGDAAATGLFQVKDYDETFNDSGDLPVTFSETWTDVPIASGVTFGFKPKSLSYEVSGEIKTTGTLSASTNFKGNLKLEPWWGGKNMAPDLHTTSEFSFSGDGVKLVKSDLVVTKAKLDGFITGTMDCRVVFGISASDCSFDYYLDLGSV